MPITKGVGNPESYNIRKLADGSWLLGIHTKDDFLEFPYDNTKDLLASLADELEGKDEKKEKSGFKKMMDKNEDKEEESGHESDHN